MSTKQRSTDRSPMVDFALGDSSLGKVLVARSSKGVCAIFMDEDAEKLERALFETFSDARRVENDGGEGAELKQTLAKVIDYIDDPRQDLDLVFDLHGTEFQRSVWGELREIPLGKTATYTEIAIALGKPTAARAVAGACAANLVSIAIPCHRVVRSDGSLSGYRWGIERKRALLEREGVLKKQSTL